MTIKTNIRTPIRVFVTTKTEAEKEATEAGVNGQWFGLNYYANKEEFIEAATKYATERLKDSDPELVFHRYDTDIDVTGLTNEDDIKDDLWTMLGLSELEFDLLQGYVSFYEILDEGVVAALKAARNDLIGLYPNPKDFVIHKLNDAGASEAVIEMLGDHCNWEAMAVELNDGFVHNNYYFNL